MEKVYIAYESDHGLVCIAKTYEDAVDYLIKNNWIDWQLVRTMFEEDGRDIPEDLEKYIQNMSEVAFELFFAGYFYIREREVYEKEW